MGCVYSTRWDVWNKKDNLLLSEDQLAELSVTLPGSPVSMDHYIKHTDGMGSVEESWLDREGSLWVALVLNTTDSYMRTWGIVVTWPCLCLSLSHLLVEKTDKCLPVEVSLTREPARQGCHASFIPKRHLPDFRNSTTRRHAQPEGTR